MDGQHVSMGTRSRNVFQNFIALNRKSIIKILNSKTNKNLVQHVHSISRMLAKELAGAEVGEILKSLFGYPSDIWHPAYPSHPLSIIIRLATSLHTTSTYMVV